MNSDPRVHDAVPLKTGGALVALGDEGIHLYARDGKLLHRWPCPARHLTLSDDEQRAISHDPSRQSRRGHVQSLHRLDLVSGTAAFWCEGEFEVAASRFDGRVWYVAPDDWSNPGGTIEGIDTQAPAFERVAQGHQFLIWPMRVRRLADQLYVWSSSLGAIHIQIYKLPSLKYLGGDVLRIPDGLDRSSQQGDQAAAQNALLWAERLFDAELPPLTHEPVYLIDSPQARSPWGTSRLRDLEGTWAHHFTARAAGFDAAGRWAAVLLRHPTRCEAVCFDLDERRPCWAHTFAAAQEDYTQASQWPAGYGSDCGGVRIEGDRLAGWDAAGEVVVFDMRAQRIELRIRLLP